MQTIELELLAFEKQGLKRSLKNASGIDFSSNDYLGFARSDEIRQELILFLQSHPSLGSTGSRLISAENDFVHQTERSLAKIFNCESVLFFGSGYLANLGAAGALGADDAEFFSDELNHASLIDGMRLARGKRHIYRHRDLNHLEGLLLKSRSSRKVIVTESVFSMDGDTPDLSSIVHLCEKSGAFLIVDEAHATGVCGNRGLGLMDDLAYNGERTVIIHTGGKALGGYGAFIISGEKVRDLMINKARSFIYSTAPPPVLIAQTLMAISRASKEASLRLRISENINYTRNAFHKNNLTWNGSHIGFMLIPGNEKVLSVSKQLEIKGLQVKAIRSPTVPTGEERLRYTIKAFHSFADIQQLVNTLNEVLA